MIEIDHSFLLACYNYLTVKILVKVKAGAKQEFVRQIGANNFVVSVMAAPEKGKANEAVRSALADYFNVPKFSIKILAGHTTKNKLIQIHV